MGANTDIYETKIKNMLIQYNIRSEKRTYEIVARSVLEAIKRFKKIAVDENICEITTQKKEFVLCAAIKQTRSHERYTKYYHVECFKIAKY